jgi:hypothetical protein
LYTNLNSRLQDGQKLILSSRRAWFTEGFSVEHSAPEDHFTLAGRPPEGLKPDQCKIGGSTKVILKAYNPDGKVITVDSHSARKDDKFTVTYPIAPQMERGVFADAEIHWSKTFSTAGSGPVEFQIAFGAKQNLWRYYFITDLKRSGNEFKIVDTDPSDSKTALIFSDKNRTDLNQHPDSSDLLAQELIQQYPDPRIQKLRFISDKQIACRQAARKYLQLWMGESPLIGALPNPSIRHYTQTDVTPGADQDRQDSLFQVVEYLTHPT